MKNIKLKICGMKYPENIKQVADLQPDYMGFIFYGKSKRFFNGTIPEIDKKIKKTGVFVGESLETVLEKIDQYGLKAVQLHGGESQKFCSSLQKNTDAEILKVFSVGDRFDLSVLSSYEAVCDFFLFDTKGKEKGGNGTTFDWKLLKDYAVNKPFFLSGGIGMDETGALKEFFKSKVSEFCYGLDINSRFEDQPGLKNIKQLKLFIEDLKKLR